MVEECCVQVEAGPVRARGQYASENVGISNIYTCENHVHQKSKVSWAMIIIPGLADPKFGPERVRIMANTVDIP